MAYYSIADKCSLLEKINSTIKLTSLLNLFGEQIEKLGRLDGYLINLVDPTETSLVSWKVHFIGEYQSLENTYAGYKVALAPDASNLSARAYLQRQTIQADIANATDEVKRLLGLWKLEDIAVIPLMLAEDRQVAKLPGTIGSNSWSSIPISKPRPMAAFLIHSCAIPICFFLMYKRSGICRCPPMTRPP